MGSVLVHTTEPAAPRLAQRVDWLGLGFWLPEDWEIVRHGTNPEHGKLVFVDRRRERLRVSWTACEKAPDLARLIADFSEQEGGETIGAPWQRPDGTRGFSCSAADGTLVRAVRYDAAQRRLLELSLSAEDSPQASQLIHALLDSLSSAEAGFRFSAFGLAVRGAAELSLVSANIRPMDARLELSLAGARISLRKLGAAESWFSGDYRGWLAKQRPLADFRAFEPERVHGHDGLRARGAERVALLPRLLGRQPKLEALLWLCPHDNALYELCASGANTAAGASKSRGLLDPATLSVACCGTREEHDHG